MASIIIKHVGIGKCLLTCHSQIQKKQNSWKKAFTRNFSSYIRAGERPPDWQYVREVARQFELTIPQTQAPDVLLLRCARFLNKCERLARALEKVTIWRWLGQSILTGMWVDTQSSSDLPNEAKPDETEIADDGDPVIQMVRDIYAVVGDDINRREPFAWISHWCLEVIDRENLDPGTELARAYIAAWEYIKKKTQ